MNKHNLIRLGAVAQRIYNMNDGFDIVELPADAPIVYMAPIVSSYNTMGGYDEYDEVNLKKVGTTSEYERMWIGYSKKANVFVIKEVT